MTSLSSWAFSGMTSLKEMTAREWEIFYNGARAYGCLKNGGLIGSSRFISHGVTMHTCVLTKMSVMCNHRKGRFRYGIGRERRLPASDDPAYKHNQERDTLKEAVSELMDRVNQGEFTSSYVYNDILKRCANERDLECVKQVHDLVKDSKMEQHPFVGTMLLRCYIECGTMEAAEETLNKLSTKGTVMWNRMIAGHVKLGQADGAIEMYKKMRNEGGRADVATYLSVLKACASPRTLNWGEKIHAHIVRDGLQGDVRIGTSLVGMYARCGSIEEARAVFGKMGRRNVISWNVMIGALAEHGLGHEAFSLFLRMQGEGFIPDAITCMSILNPSSSNGALEWVREVHAHATRAGLDVDVRVQNALIQMYAKSGSIEDARAVFMRMGNRDTVSWNVMIGALAEHGIGHEAFSLFLQMQREGLTPDSVTYISILNPSSSTGALEWVRKVHAHATRAGYDVDVRVQSSLIQIYTKSGSIEDARAVFDKMGRRDTVSWNVMIHALAEHGLGHEAFSLVLRMQREGFTPDAVTYVSILNPSSSTDALEWVKEVHAHASRSGFDVDVPVQNALIQMYAKSSSIEDARAVFIKMGSRDIVSWNVMIGALAEHGLGHEAFSLFLRMLKEGFVPDAITYVSILNPLSGTGALEWVKEVHAHARRAGYDVDVRVQSCLIQMYAKSGSIDDARAVFGNMRRRNVVSWNVMIGSLARHGLGQEAFSLFLRMQREGFTPDAISYMSILNPSSSNGALEWVKEVHAHATRAGFNVDVRVQNALIQMYAKSGSIEDARAAFGKMGTRDVVSWNVMIGALAEHGLGHEAFSFLLQMQREGFTPDEIIYLSILNPCPSAGALKWLGEVHAHATRAGFDVDLRVQNALIQMYAKSGSIEDARAAFGKMGSRDVVSWNVMIGALAEHGLGHEAFSLFLRMQRDGFRPDAVTYISILSPSSSTGALEWVREVHAHATRAGFDVDVRVQSSLIQMYAKSGSIEEAREVFENMQSRDVVSFTMMISGFAQHGHGREGMQVFKRMKSEGLKPDNVVFVAVLSACAHAGLVEEGLLQFESMKKDYGIEPEMEHYTCIVDLFGRAGRLKEAEVFILNMPFKPDFVTWSTLLGACRTHNNIKLAEVAAEECLKLNPTDAATYVLLSNVYAAVGKWDQVTKIRSVMKRRGVRKEPGRSWIEIDNKVHQFQVGDTEHPETREIYTMLTSLSNSLKAEGYIADTRLVLRDIAEEDKESALCSHSEKLAIAYGLMYVPAGKPIRIFKNLRICTDCHTASKLISRITGRQIVARDAIRFHHFIDGSCSCNDYW